MVEAGEPNSGMIGYTLENGGGMSMLRVTEMGTVVVGGADFTGWEVVVISVIACFAIACAICTWNVVTLLRHAWYGYEMAGYAGIALFCGFQTAAFLWLMLSGGVAGFGDFAFAVTQLADRFVFVLLVPMSLAAALVSVSNVMLMRNEGRSFGNMLGFLLSGAWAVACAVWSAIDVNSYETVQEFIFLSGLASAVSAGISFAAALFIGTCLCAWGASVHVPSKPRDFLVVLGCALRPDGSPTPLLAGRADAAFAFAQEQEAQGMPAPTFVPSGGQGSDECCSEAESMRRFLEAKGVPAGQIALEDRSTTTRENMRFSAEVIAREASEAGLAEPSVAFATTNYHVFRGYVFAHEAGMAAEGIAAPTKIWFWPNAFLREFVGLIAARFIHILLAFVGIAAVYLSCEYAVLMQLG